MKHVFIMIMMLCFQQVFVHSVQSPYLSVEASMDSVSTGSVNYKIKMKICEPMKKSPHGNVFDSTVSTIDFAGLKANDMTCREYISTDDRNREFNHFHFGNQVFAWEKIIILEITNRSSRGWWPEMYIVLPIKAKSFITSIRLKDIIFQSGTTIWLNDTGVITTGRQAIELSLKGIKGVPLTDSPWKIY